MILRLLPALPYRNIFTHIPFFIVMVYQEARFRSRHVPKKRETLAESKQDFKVRIRKLCEMSKQHLHNEEPPSGEGERQSRVKEHVPTAKLSLARNIVLRPDTRINVPMISAYRKWLRAEQRMADLLADTTASKSFVQMRLAATAGAEEYVVKQFSSFTL